MKHGHTSVPWEECLRRLRLPPSFSGVDSINEGPGKAMNISKIFGRRPVAAFGNSHGDLQMLQWTVAGPAHG